MRKGIDISKYDQQVDFDTLKGVIDFIWIKTSSGTRLTDDLYLRNRAEAERVGLPYGLYHYAYPEYNSPENEADWFATLVGTTLPRALSLDYESAWSGDKVDWCKRFLDRLASHYNGCRAYLYLNLNTVRDNNWKPVVDAGYPLWLAHWDYVPENPPPTDTAWSTIQVRQYSNHETMLGCPTPVDGDVWYDEIVLASSPPPEHLVESIGTEFAGNPSYTVMRQVPTDNYQEVTVVKSFGSHFDKGWIGRVIKEQGDWYLISIAGGIQQGWVKKKYTKVPGSPDPITTFSVTTTTALRERQAPTTQSTRVGLLSKGATVVAVDTVSGESIHGNSDWYKLENGTFISAYYTTK